ncbi:MAG: insulinase family protein, partial [Phycisphaerales bacterium]|nr:insulinase family protein [Phycisphaerales bacterium]
ILAVSLPLSAVAGTCIAQPVAPQPAPAAAAPKAGPDMNNDPTPLPTDPALVTGELANGVKYIIRNHAQPEGRAAVWMHVGTGSLNETDRQRGIAHYLEHMAFNGSANFPPGSVVKFFEDLGLTFGRHQNAFTSFDQTSFQLFLGDNTPETLDKALMFMSDVAFRLTLDAKEIENERQVILEEKRSRKGPQQRIQDVMLKRLAPGSLIGERLPIGVDETITGVQQQDFRDYWSKWYTPTNTTVIVVADMDPAAVKAAIEKRFGVEPRRPAPNSMDPAVKPYTADGAVVVTDPEIKRAEVGMVKVSEPPPPTTTVGRFRSDLVETIGTFAFNRRLAAKRDEGKVSFLNASASTQTLFNAARLTQADVSAEPDKWREAFSQLATELQRARLNGFTDQEVADARAELISQAEVAARRESTLDARALVARYSTSINDGEPIMSAQQVLDLMRSVLPGVSTREVSDRFAAEFDPTHVMFTAELPEGAGTDTVTEADLMKFGRLALDVKPAKEADTARITRLLPRDPVPGRAEDVTTHQPTGVTSFWLSNGVRVEHKFIDTEKDALTLTISLAAGAIDETPQTRGVSDAAALAFAHPATRSYTSTQLREFMTGRKVGVRGGAGEDTFNLTVSGSPGDLETGLQMAHALLTEPRVEPAALDRWKKTELQNIAQRKTQPQGVIMEMIAEALFPPGEVRRRPLTAEQVNALTVEQAQARIDSVTSSSPIEVTVVGDAPIEQVRPLIEKYLGSLPNHDRISAKTLDEKRTMQRLPGPRSVERTIPTKTPVAIVLGGFFGADAENVKDVRLLALASQVLNSRMIKEIREEKQLVYSIGTQHQPAVAYPGFGIFYAGAPTAKEKAQDLAQAITDTYDRFAKEGPTDDELATAKKQLLRDLDENMKKASWWAGVVGNATYRNRNLDDIAGARAAIEAFTAVQVRQAFNRYYTPENAMRFTVLPEDAPAAAPDPAAKPEAGAPGGH